MRQPLELTKSDFQVIWREKERQDEKIRALEERGDQSPITAAALRRHQLIREALLFYYRSNHYRN